ncbi:MAG: hypothetical protein FWG77_07495 [Treponema sp.]|nr:hypothetical protein [Treponema sp.]
MCWYCGSAIKENEPIGRSLACLDCGKDLRSCKNCRHLRKDGCAESAASGEKPSDAERANFCDWFSLNPVYRNETEGEQKSKKSSDDAKSALNDLFR